MKARLYCIQGFYEQAETELNYAQEIYAELGYGGYVISALIDKSYLGLIEYRAYEQPESLEKSRISILRAFQLADDSNNSGYETEIQIDWLRGAVYSRLQQFDLAESCLLNSLNLCRATNLITLEYEVVLEYARLCYFLGRYQEALKFSEEALLIAERCKYKLRATDAQVFLARFAMEQEKDKFKAKEYAKTALKLATCDGPPYYYKVAYEEAERFLEILQ